MVTRFSTLVKLKASCRDCDTPNSASGGSVIPHSKRKYSVEYQVNISIFTGLFGVASFDVPRVRQIFTSKPTHRILKVRPLEPGRACLRWFKRM